MKLKILIGVILLPLSAFANEINNTESAYLIIGGGFGFADLTHYPGANESDNYFLPLPYLDYKKNNLTINDEGLNAKILNSRSLSLDFDVTGSLPVSSDKNKARSGMPDLGLFIELGPEISIALIEDQKYSISLDIPARFSLELMGENQKLNEKIIQDSGSLLEPRIHFEHRNDNIQIELDVGFIWADKKYQSRFFSVSEDFELPSRQIFYAKKGKMGNRISSTIKYENDSWIFLGYLKFIDLSEGTNRASPLIKDDNYMISGFGVIRKFKIW